jgi:hypothetical protein
VVTLQQDVDDALEQAEDSNRHMAIYRGGDNLSPRVRKQCFTKDGKPLRPHKLNDMLQKLHVRLGCHLQHSIPIGFYYAKWSEKLQFHLARAGRQDRSLLTTSRTRTPTPTSASVRSPSPMDKSPMIAPSSVAVDIMSMSIEEEAKRLDEIKAKRAAIFDDTSDGRLTKKNKAVFWYRENRRLAWKAASAETMMNESEWSDRYDQEQLEELQKTEEQLETLLAMHLKSIGYGPAGQDSN